MKTLEERFWEKVDKDGPYSEILKSKCWVWVAGKSKYGYGYFCPQGKQMIGAHRFSWEQSNGPIPSGLCVLHTCDNPPCVSPYHLFLGTRHDNTDDMVSKQRNARGEKSGTAKLTGEQVEEIITSSLNGRALSKKFGVCCAQISRIRRGVEWTANTEKYRTLED